MRLIDFFTHPVLRAPTIGSMLMCFALALVGVLVFVRKRSLLGETLSHATYPGVTIAIVVGGVGAFDKSIPFLVFGGAFISSLAGFWLVDCLKRRLKTSDDSALCFVIALFFGIGTVVASYAQFSHPHLFGQIQAYLYGQTTTMVDYHILLYGAVALLVYLVILLFYKEIFILSFDPQFAQSVGIPRKWIDTLVFGLIVLAVVMGIRGMGVMLTSAMLIAPAVAARQFTHRFKYLFLLSGLFGMLSAFFGNYLSAIPIGGHKLYLPTGPLIVLVAGFFAVGALLLAPQRGLVVRMLRMMRFRRERVQENILKSLWRLTYGGKSPVSFFHIVEEQGFSKWYLKMLLLRLRWRGWVKQSRERYWLTPKGTRRGGQITRLHRLWELYLVNSLGVDVERVHSSAEEMEHILTPGLEKQLTLLLDNPKHDPHKQPIPAGEEEISYSQSLF